MVVNTDLRLPLVFENGSLRDCVLSNKCRSFFINSIIVNINIVNWHMILNTGGISLLLNIDEFEFDGNIHLKNGCLTVKQGNLIKNRSERDEVAGLHKPTNRCR